jgi:endonuclease-3 related protein
MKELNAIYEELFRFYGPQNWWPGEGLEIAVGAVLTQQTSWTNVEKALLKIKENNCMSLNCLQSLPISRLEELIRSSGYYRVKAKRLKNLVDLLMKHPVPDRKMLLSVNGIGYETADSILLYQFEIPYFVIDAYTFRILERLGIYSGRDYSELQRIFMESIPNDIQIYKEFHALLVVHAKNHCIKSNPICSTCPLRYSCKYQKENNE